MNNKDISFTKPESISDEQLEKYQFRVCVGTFGDYNRGNENHGWITLPVPEEKLNRFLNEVVKVGPDNSEIMLQDFNLNPFHISESENIWDLNDAATIWETLDSDQKLKVRAYSDWNDGNLSLLELTNGMIMADEIPYYSYDVDGDSLTRHEKMGYTIAEQNHLQELLEDFDKDGKALSAFDFAWYGKLYEDERMSLYEHGYYDQSYSGSIEYSKEDIHDIAENTRKEMFQPSLQNYEDEIKTGRVNSQDDKSHKKVL